MKEEKMICYFCGKKRSSKFCPDCGRALNLNFYSTLEVAKMLNISITKFQRAIWLKQIKLLPKKIGRSYIWTIEHIQRASWQLLSHEFKYKINDRNS